MKQDFYTTPKAGWIMRSLWSCAGADSYILERSTYTDHVKYACLGGIVFATGFMAAMAGGYAFYIIFEPRGAAIESSVEVIQNGIASVNDTIANVTSSNLSQTKELDNDSAHLPTSIFSIIFGIIWGLIIFNIDRFIVASTGKGDGTETITWSEIKGSIPRILMGIIIALTISKPVELRMFKTEIDVKLHQRQQDEYAASEKRAIAVCQPPIDAIDSQIFAIQDEIREKDTDHKNAVILFNSEMDRSGGTGSYGYGEVAKKKEATANRILEELKELRIVKNLSIDRLKEDRLTAVEKLNSEKAKSEARSNSLNGLLERIKILGIIAPWYLTLFITLLFMTIELTPIFFKMMLIKSPYDFMSDNIKSLLKAEQGIEIKYDFYKDKEGVQRDLVINHQADRLMKEKIKLLQTQTELSEVVMENWKTKETKNIKANPESYIDKKS